MNSKPNIEDQIERALHSMDNHKPASAAPYLMTRINAALAGEKMQTVWDKLYSIITKPVVAFAGIAFILILNILIITSYRDNDAVRFQSDSNADWQSYSTATNSALYDVENNIEP